MRCDPSWMLVVTRVRLSTRNVYRSATDVYLASSRLRVTSQVAAWRCGAC
jgi:hypothetical protein